MFKLFNNNKQKEGEEIEIKIDGMHCASCSLNIDDALEDTEGVIKASTSYAKSVSKIQYDKEKIDKEKIIKVIKDTGYNASEI